MMDWLRTLLDSDSLSPHGICLLWRPELMWTHVITDALIAGAYLSIPLALAYLVSKRGDIAFGWIFWCFVTFILACGTTHVLSIVTLWKPIYGIEALVKVVTAVASVATAIALWPLIPRVLSLPSPMQLRAANEALTVRAYERDRAMRALEQATAERVRTEDMLRQAQKMEALGHLTGGFAHDFNNLLNVVIANLERAKRQLPEDSPQQREIRNAMSGAERAASITHQLLAFARQQPLRPADLRLNILMSDLSELLRGAVGSRIDLDLSLAPDLWPVRADANQLENAILNLVVNARDAMDQNGASHLSIWARNIPATEARRTDGLNPDRDHVMIAIEDKGVGMTEAVAAHAFEPFFTTKPVGQGTGLGLSQVFGFVKQSGGHAAIATKLGAGTTVRLYLPRSQPAELPSAESSLSSRIPVAGFATA